MPDRTISLPNPWALAATTRWSNRQSQRFVFGRPLGIRFPLVSPCVHLFAMRTLMVAWPHGDGERQAGGDDCRGHERGEVGGPGNHGGAGALRGRSPDRGGRAHRGGASWLISASTSENCAAS